MGEMADDFSPGGRCAHEPDKYDWNTYNDWKFLGYRVKCGEKSIRRNKIGIPLFNGLQVEEDWMRDESASECIY